jgi:hypothetical protein
VPQKRKHEGVFWAGALTKSSEGIKLDQPLAAQPLAAKNDERTARMTGENGAIPRRITPFSRLGAPS